MAKYHGFAAYQIAPVFAWRGDIDHAFEWHAFEWHAFEWLENASAQNDGGLTQVKVDSMPTLAGGSARRRDVAENEIAAVAQCADPIWPLIANGEGGTEIIGGSAHNLRRRWRDLRKLFYSAALAVWTPRVPLTGDFYRCQCLPV